MCKCHFKSHLKFFQSFSNIWTSDHDCIYHLFIIHNWSTGNRTLSQNIRDTAQGSGICREIFLEATVVPQQERNLSSLKLAYPVSTQFLFLQIQKNCVFYFRPQSISHYSFFILFRVVLLLLTNTFIIKQSPAHDISQDS